ncbi:hypothetical protein AGLY_004668 [Aphis glycines]|uniref:Uncharacterized protein n=1 Tax=Aphis glycines TaxID=307491 RepID=A0A6G0TVT8_APHGL|nr:hypothetical protein AGLY_004668 [Aphis glycines]
MNSERVCTDIAETGRPLGIYNTEIIVKTRKRVVLSYIYVTCVERGFMVRKNKRSVKKNNYTTFQWFQKKLNECYMTCNNKNKISTYRYVSIFYQNMYTDILCNYQGVGIPKKLRNMNIFQSIQTTIRLSNPSNFSKTYRKACEVYTLNSELTTKIRLIRIIPVLESNTVEFMEYGTGKIFINRDLLINKLYNKISNLDGKMNVTERSKWDAFAKGMLSINSSKNSKSFEN